MLAEVTQLLCSRLINRLYCLQPVFGSVACIFPGVENRCTCQLAVIRTGLCRFHSRVFWRKRKSIANNAVIKYKAPIPIGCIG